MTLQGNLCEPYRFSDTVVETTDGALENHMISVWEILKSDIWLAESSIKTARFPVPPIAGGFLVSIDFEMELIGTAPPYSLAGALYPESAYLEPTFGQIWPRIG